MKVSVAAQTFSCTVAAVMKKIASTDSGLLPREAVDTAEFILFMDKVFDSVYGLSVKPLSGKNLRYAVSERTEHVEFWSQSIEVFKTIHFYNNKKKHTIPPTVKNWIYALKGFVYLWQKLKTQNFYAPEILTRILLKTFLAALGVTATEMLIQIHFFSLILLKHW